MNGATDYEGRVEILYNGTWGTVCHYAWDNRDAEVVCRQLGYSGGTAYRSSFFGAGNGEIWTADVECMGNETELGLCNHVCWGCPRYYCNHRYDAGVGCGA